MDMNIKTNVKLCDWGLDKGTQEQYNSMFSEYTLGRVVEEHKNLYKVITESGFVIAKVSGKIIFNAIDGSEYPSVGDWVVLDLSNGSEGKSRIVSILPRKSKFSRKISGNTFEEQVVVSNIDTIFICMALNKDFNLKRLDRYTALAWDSGATPVVILTKADLCDDLENLYEQVLGITYGIETIITSALDNTGFDRVMEYIAYGKTVALIGSSGVGKSTLINKIIGNEEQVTQKLMDDDRGKHTTTFRKLIQVQKGGIIVDTPGMKEVGLISDSEGLEDAFKDIYDLAKQCKFSDCKHEKEPGCAVKDAIDRGVLTKQRYANYVKLKREAAYMERKLNKGDGRKESKKFGKQVKNMKKIKY